MLQKRILIRNSDSVLFCPETLMAKGQLSQSEKVALRERIKELTCLYGIAQIARQPKKSSVKTLILRFWHCLHIATGVL
jgi:hypothetical protein